MRNGIVDVVYCFFDEVSHNAMQYYVLPGVEWSERVFKNLVAQIAVGEPNEYSFRLVGRFDGLMFLDAARNNQNSNVMSSVLSSTLSGQLNNALSQVFETNNWNIGTNLSTGDKGWTDMEVEGILSGQLLNNRLLVNGNFGYRDNPMANTNFIGDFEAEWLINRSGDIRLKAYNETNDRYYTKTNLTTQGVGIMYKKDFNKWSDLFFWNKWKLRNKRKREETEKVQQQQTDSIADDKAKSELKRKRAQK